MSNLVLVEHFRLFHFLHRDNLIGLFELADANLSKCTSSDNAEGIEVFKSYLLAPKRIDSYTIGEHLTFSC